MTYLSLAFSLANILQANIEETITIATGEKDCLCSNKTIVHNNNTNKEVLQWRSRGLILEQSPAASTVEKKIQYELTRRIKTHQKDSLYKPKNF